MCPEVGVSNSFIHLVHVSRAPPFTTGSSDDASGGNMASKGLRQRNRRGSKQDASTASSPAVNENRAVKDEKGAEDSKPTEPRNEWVTPAGNFSAVVYLRALSGGSLI